MSFLITVEHLPAASGPGLAEVFELLWGRELYGSVAE
jgi:hypothetical protein